MNTENKFYQSVAGLALATGALLLVPLIAMQFTDEVVWTLSDFIIMGTLIFGTGFTYQLVTRKTGETVYRVAVGFALVSAFLLIWVNGAVGIIGSENNEINQWYFGVILVGILGALLARFRSRGMILTMIAMATAQLTIAVIALFTGMADLPHSSVMEIISVNGFFAALFTFSAFIFIHAAKEEDEPDT